MPRETIPNETPSDRFNVKVGWNPLGSVQVGVELGGDPGLIWTLLGENPQVRATLGKSLRSMLAEGTSNLSDDVLAERVLVVVAQSSASYRGVWATLDRSGCNRLISVVRRARDAAFGRDE